MGGIGPVRGSRLGRARRALVVVMVLGVLVAEGRAAPPKTPPRPDTAKQIEAVSAELAAARQEIAQLQETLRAVREALAARDEALERHRQAAAEAETAAKTVQAEIVELAKGLYVETSSVKGDLALLREDVQALSANIESSRLGSGILLAAVIALQVLLVLLAIRARR